MTSYSRVPESHDFRGEAALDTPLPPYHGSLKDGLLDNNDLLSSTHHHMQLCKIIIRIGRRRRKRILLFLLPIHDTI